MGRFGRNWLIAASAAVVVGAVALQGAPSTASGASTRATFSVQVAIAPSLLQQPVAAVTASDGRVFVAQLNGVIKVFHGVADTHPATFADLRNEVYSAQGHGLLGITLDPQFPTKPYVYVLYSRDSATRGGPISTNKDTCPTHATTGCVRYARLARLTANGDKMVAGSLKKLIDDWCNQFVHHIGALHFGSDGMLYVSAGDGATEQVSGSSGADYGQFANACGDPPSPAGTNLTPPTAQGGSLRTQDILTGYDTDPVTLDGTIIRVNPATGQAVSGNPYFSSSSDANERRIIGYGLRNPFRFAIQPGTSKLYVADPGLDDYEEIDWIARPVKSAANNFGWPCWEGTDKQVYFKALHLNMCNSLYAANSDTKPVFEYHDSSPSVSPGDSCPEISPEGSGGAITGIAFPGPGNSYPTASKSQVFFVDYGRQCIWSAPVPPTGSATQPLLHPQLVAPLPATGVTDIEAGPTGDLLLVDVANSTVYELTYA